MAISSPPPIEYGFGGGITPMGLVNCISSGFTHSPLEYALSFFNRIVREVLSHFHENPWQNSQLSDGITEISKQNEDQLSTGNTFNSESFSRNQINSKISTIQSSPITQSDQTYMNQISSKPIITNSASQQHKLLQDSNESRFIDIQLEQIDAQHEREQLISRIIGQQQLAASNIDENTSTLRLACSSDDADQVFYLMAQSPNIKRPISNLLFTESHRQLFDIIGQQFLLTSGVRFWPRTNPTQSGDSGINTSGASASDLQSVQMGQGNNVMEGYSMRSGMIALAEDVTTTRQHHLVLGSEAQFVAVQNLVTSPYSYQSSLFLFLLSALNLWDSLMSIIDPCVFSKAPSPLSFSIQPPICSQIGSSITKVNYLSTAMMQSILDVDSSVRFLPGELGDQNMVDVARQIILRSITTKRKLPQQSQNLGSTSLKSTSSFRTVPQFAFLILKEQGKDPSFKIMNNNLHEQLKDETLQISGYDFSHNTFQSRPRPLAVNTNQNVGNQSQYSINTPQNIYSQELEYFSYIGSVGQCSFKTFSYGDQTAKSASISISNTIISRKRIRNYWIIAKKGDLPGSLNPRRFALQNLISFQSFDPYWPSALALFMHNGSRSIFLIQNMLSPIVTDLMTRWTCPREYIGSWSVYSSTAEANNRTIWPYILNLLYEIVTLPLISKQVELLLDNMLTIKTEKQQNTQVLTIHDRSDGVVTNLTDKGYQNQGGNQNIHQLLTSLMKEKQFMISYKIANSIEAKGKSSVPDPVYQSIIRVLTTAGTMDRFLPTLKQFTSLDSKSFNFILQVTILTSFDFTLHNSRSTKPTVRYQTGGQSSQMQQTNSMREPQLKSDLQTRKYSFAFYEEQLILKSQPLTRYTYLEESIPVHGSLSRSQFELLSQILFYVEAITVDRTQSFLFALVDIKEKLL
ncbi:MAG: hypothetical protein EZS28_031981, partial [Streblomastix strix]